MAKRQASWKVISVSVLAALSLVAVAGGCTTAAPPAQQPAAPASQQPAVPAQPAPLKKISFVLGFTSPNSIPIWAAMDKGFYQKYGYEVEQTMLDGGPKGIAAVVGGSADISLGAGGTWLGPIAQGAQIKILATLVSGSSDSLLVKPEIDAPAKLKGKKIAIGGFGDLSHLTSWLMVEKMGLDPAKDVAYVQIGSDPARAAALQSGAVDAAPLNATNGDKLEKEFGFRALIRGAEANISFPSTNVGVSAANVEKNPGMLKAFLKGTLDGIDWIYNPANEKEAKEIYARYYKTKPDDPSMAVAYNSVVKGKAIGNPPWIDREGFVKVQDFSVQFNPALKNVDLKQVLDQSLLEAAVKERK